MALSLLHTSRLRSQEMLVGNTIFVSLTEACAWMSDVVDASWHVHTLTGYTRHVAKQENYTNFIQTKSVADTQWLTMFRMESTMLGEGVLLQCCLHLKLGCLFTNTNIEQRILHVWSVKERVRAWHYTDSDTTSQHYTPLHHLPLIMKHKYKH